MGTEAVAVVGYGVFLPTHSSSAEITVDGVLSLARQAERAGLDHLWVGDHFVWNAGMLAPLPTLAAVAASTTSIRLGTAVYLLNLRTPAIAAKEIATVDLLARGRLIMGVGAGGDNPLEYEALGLSVTGRGVRLDNMILAVRRLLAGDDIGLIRDYFQLPDFRMAPQSTQVAIPIWIGGRADAVVRRAARLGDGWFPTWVSPHRFKTALEQVASERIGGLNGFAAAMNIFTRIDTTHEAAEESVARHLNNAYQLPFETFRRYTAFGTAQEVAEYVSAYLVAGATDIVFNFGGQHPEEQLDRLVSDVLPLLTGSNQ
jgi:alkanesulfonate monooxygenase SsuD/methylene tetrahydromethanopterin reductase-like flavin-dependent oxidoreductase (luciferase family)